MRFKTKREGKYVVIDPNNPEPIGVCDITGQFFNHKDLIKQMEWRGNHLVWTGLLVGKPYLDKPQQQNRPYPVKADPYPVKNPRPLIKTSGNDFTSFSEIQERLRNYKAGS